VEWLIDTGAAISALTKDKADQLDLVPLGISTSGTTGGGGILIKSGAEMAFTIRGSTGTDVAVRCAMPVGVKPNNFGSDILGMDQLAHVGAKVLWDPSAQDGDLFR
jgi:hypothetical protein